MRLPQNDLHQLQEPITRILTVGSGSGATGSIDCRKRVVIGHRVPDQSGGEGGGEGVQVCFGSVGDASLGFPGKLFLL